MRLSTQRVTYYSSAYLPAATQSAASPVTYCVRGRNGLRSNPQLHPVRLCQPLDCHMVTVASRLQNGTAIEPPVIAIGRPFRSATAGSARPRISNCVWGGFYETSIAQRGTELSSFRQPPATVSEAKRRLLELRSTRGNMIEPRRASSTAVNGRGET